MSFEFPYKYAHICGLGRIFYPIVRLQLKTISGWREFEFLVDTGADVTTVPTHLLPVLCIKKSQLSSTHTFGVGGISVKTWEFTLVMKLGVNEFSVYASAVDAKNDTLPLLLGRKDVFESKFNLLLDSQNKKTVIVENQ